MIIYIFFLMCQRINQTGICQLGPLPVPITWRARCFSLPHGSDAMPKKACRRPAKAAGSNFRYSISCFLTFFKIYLENFPKNVPSQNAYCSRKALTWVNRSSVQKLYSLIAQIPQLLHQLSHIAIFPLGKLIINGKGSIFPS